MIYDDIPEAVKQAVEAFCQVKELLDSFAELVCENYNKFMMDEELCIIDREPLPKPPKVIHMKNFILDRRQKIHRCRNNC